MRADELNDFVVAGASDDGYAIGGDEEAENVLCVQLSALEVACVGDASLDLLRCQ